MANTNTFVYRRGRMYCAARENKYQHQFVFVSLMVIAFMLSGCLSSLEEDLERAIAEGLEEYKKEYKEEFALLLDIPTYFGDSELSNDKLPSPDEITSPLYSFLVQMTKNKQPVFTLTTTVIQFHYPVEFKEITFERRVDIEVSGIYLDAQTNKPGALRSSLSVFERDNKNKTGALYAQCRFLLQIYGYPPGTSSETANFVWLFCRCTWDTEKQLWKVSNIRRLSDGEMILEHY